MKTPGYQNPSDDPTSGNPTSALFKAISKRYAAHTLAGDLGNTEVSLADENNKVSDHDQTDADMVIHNQEKYDAIDKDQDPEPDMPSDESTQSMVEEMSGGDQNTLRYLKQKAGMPID